MIKFDVLNRWTLSVQFTAEINCKASASVSVKRGLALKWAYLKGANLKGEIPKIKDIHKKVYAAAKCEGALKMDQWHSCDTTHCRAGWVVILAGEKGKELETKIGTPAAAALIYWNSDPKLKQLPDFYCGNDEALADMKKLAGVK